VLPKSPRSSVPTARPIAPRIASRVSSLRVMQAIETWSHGGLGGPMAQCDRCGARSCGTTRVAIATVPSATPWPSCAGFEARCSELETFPIFHGVLTYRTSSIPWPKANPQLALRLLFASAAAPLQTFGRDPGGSAVRSA